MITFWRGIMQKTLMKRYSSTLKGYEETLKALYNLQSNAQYLKSVTANKRDKSNQILTTEKYLLRAGITLDKLDSLSVIHVAGTKGKGSSCAYTEAILREHGYTTGFYSSPHLVTVRERIRINGAPISQSLFIKYFWEVYEKLEEGKEHEYDMPTYFKFLTILMFSLFINLKVDVAIIEVGIGGLKDCTNIVRYPVCVGITSLALEHTSLLGSTIEEIAFQKAGIFKRNVPAFTVPQDPRAMKVLEKIATEQNCKLRVVPSFDKYEWETVCPATSITNDIKRQNASLAIQLATEWLNSATLNTHGYSRISMDKVAKGLLSCKWPGRMQILKSSIANFYLDGAHTLESIQCCVSWFNDETKENGKKRILIFNITGDRNATDFLVILKSLQFDKAYFVPNYAGIETVDDVTNNVRFEEQKIWCLNNANFWGPGSTVSSSLLEVLQDIKLCNLKEQSSCDVLVTGSLHLIGAILAVLDSNLTMNTEF